MEKYLILPEILRCELKKPLGELVSSYKEKDKLILCIGDSTCIQAIDSGLNPKVCVYDGKIKRKDVGIAKLIETFAGVRKHVKNPRGKLNISVFKIIKKSLEGKKNIKIEVEGEEDLIALAAIDVAPVGSVVLYGQPDEGLVVCEVNKDMKNKIKKILKEMRKKKER